VPGIHVGGIRGARQTLPQHCRQALRLRLRVLQQLQGGISRCSTSVKSLPNGNDGSMAGVARGL